MTIPEAILALSHSPELSVLLKATVLLALALTVVRMAGTPGRRSGTSSLPARSLLWRRFRW